MAIATLSLVGLLVALYLWLHNIGVIGTLQCVGSGGCERVQTSEYAYLLGQPVAFFGVVGYAVLFAVSLVGLQPAFAGRTAVTKALAALATGGFLFTLYLKYVEFFVIRSVCWWCVVSAVLMTAIWVTSLLALRDGRSADGRMGGS
jgi:uncharacterized membrane protein